MAQLNFPLLAAFGPFHEYERYSNAWDLAHAYASHDAQSAGIVEHEEDDDTWYRMVRIGARGDKATIGSAWNLSEADCIESVLEAMRRDRNVRYDDASSISQALATLDPEDDAETIAEFQGYAQRLK